MATIKQMLYKKHWYWRWRSYLLYPQDSPVGLWIDRKVVPLLPFRLLRYRYWERVLPQPSNIPYDCYVQPIFFDTGEGYGLSYDIRKKDTHDTVDEGYIDLWPTYWGYCTHKQMEQLGFEFC